MSVEEVTPSKYTITSRGIFGKKTPPTAFSIHDNVIMINQALKSVLKNIFFW